MLFESAFPALRRVSRRGVKGALGLALGVSVLASAGGPASAVSFDLFVIAEQTFPGSETDGFSITTQTVFEIDQSTWTPILAENFTFDVDGSLDFASVTNGDSTIRTDMGETGEGTATYVDSEIGTWDNVGDPTRTPYATDPPQVLKEDFNPAYDPADGYDPAEQLDFGRNSVVTFATPEEGITDLILAEMGGFNTFNLYLCPNSSCDRDTRTTIPGTRVTRVVNQLLATDYFGIADNGVENGTIAYDQTWLIRFHDTVYDFIGIRENDDRGADGIFFNNRLQLDFVGYAGPSSPPSEVPLPTGLPLMAGGLGLLALIRRRKTV